MSLFISVSNGPSPEDLVLINVAHIISMKPYAHTMSSGEKFKGTKIYLIDSRIYVVNHTLEQIVDMIR